MEEVPPKATLLQTVVDLSVPIPERMRAVFYLRSLGGSDSVEALCKSELHGAIHCSLRHLTVLFYRS